MDWKLVRRRFRIAWVTAGLLFTLWIAWSMQAHGVPADVRASSSAMSVTEGDGATVFMPATSC